VNGSSPFSATLDLPSDPSLHAMIRTFVGACAASEALSASAVINARGVRMSKF